MDLEKIATSAVSESISRTDIMSPFVNDGDKEPVWDGHIYIYSDKRKKKDNIKKIPIQVKGKKSNNLNEDIIKYPVEIACLQDYLNDGGVIFFVVYINEEGNQKQIYYSALVPIKLRMILSDINDKKTKSIEMRKFPENNDEKTTIFLNFYSNMKKQTSFAHAKLLSEEELMKQGLLEGVTISASKYGEKPDDIRELLFQDNIYMYANVKGLSVPQPLEGVLKGIYFTEEIICEITIYGVKYYNAIKRTKSKNITQYSFGKSLTIIYDKAKNERTIKIAPTSILKEALNDFPFLLSFLNSKQIEIDGVTYDFPEIQDLASQDRVTEINRRLEHLCKISSLFDCLRLDKNKDLSKMNSEDWRNTDRLINAFLEGKKVKGLKKDIPDVVMLEYIDTKLALVFVPTNREGEYFIHDFFKDSSIEAFHIKDGKRYPTSKYVMMTADSFLELGNIDYKEIFGSFRKYSLESYCFEDANYILLEMIRAFDRSKDKRTDILNEAALFARILMEEIAKNNDIYIATLNYLQIEKRKHPLTEEQKAFLIEIIESKELSDEQSKYTICVGAYLLLDNQFFAQYFYKKLNESSQKQLSNYPIWRFWSENTGAIINEKNENGNE